MRLITVPFMAILTLLFLVCMMPITIIATIIIFPCFLIKLLKKENKETVNFLMRDFIMFPFNVVENYWRDK